MSRLRDDHPLHARAARQTPPISVGGLCMLLGTYVQVAFGAPAVNVDDAARRVMGLSHVRKCSAGGSSADVLINPDTGGAVRVGFDLPLEIHPPTLARFGGASRVGGGVA